MWVLVIWFTLVGSGGMTTIDGFPKQMECLRALSEIQSVESTVHGVCISRVGGIHK